MKSIQCIKCGRTLDTSASPHHSGLPMKEAILRLASDHASKFGCDWPAANVGEVTKRMNK